LKRKPIHSALRTPKAENLRSLWIVTRFFFVFALVLALAACTSAQVNRQGYVPQEACYLAATQPRFETFPAPPATGSEADEADIQALRQWQSKRTQAECTLARTQSHGNFQGLFGAIHPFAKPLPKEVALFFKCVHADLDYAVAIIKTRYQRPRPFQRGLGFEPCIERAGGPSYPSGHAANSRLFALILSDLAPERRNAFMAHADQAALNRVIGGVHHPSDIEEGKKLAGELFVLLKQNPAFLKDLKSLEQYIVR